MPVQSTAAIFKKLPFRLLVYLAAALIFAMPARNALEQHFLYFPTSQHEATPASIGLSYEDISYNATDGTLLNGWLVPGQKDAPVILFCIGNAGNISHRLDTLQLLNDLGVAVFIFNYRGYGKSTGKANEAGTYHDVAGALDFLKQRGWPAERTIIFGRSLGAAVGLEAALQETPAGLIMESAFTSIKAMGRHHYSLLNLLLGWLIDASYDNLGKISTLRSPLLIIHGRSDKICPPRMAEELFARAPQDKRLHWIEGADHNDGFVVGGNSYKNLLAQVIREWTGFTRE